MGANWGSGSLFRHFFFYALALLDVGVGSRAGCDRWGGVDRYRSIWRRDRFDRLEFVIGMLTKLHIVEWCDVEPFMAQVCRGAHMRAPSHLDGRRGRLPPILRCPSAHLCDMVCI